MKKIIVPVSGGMDSISLLYYAKYIAKFHEIYALTFDYGQRHKNEIEFAKYHCNKLGIKEHKVIDVSFIKELTTNSSLTNQSLKIPVLKEVQGDPQLSSYVPCRNLMFLSIASSYAENVGAETVYHGSALVDSLAGYYDSSAEFLIKINETLSLNRKHRIKIEAPLIDKSKKEIIQLGLDLGVDFSKTWTCYDPIPVYSDVQTFVGLESLVTSYKSCGICSSCSARLRGWVDLGRIKDPLEYNITIDWSKYGIS